MSKSIKKILIAVLAGIMLFSYVGCSNQTNTQSDNTKEDNTKLKTTSEDYNVGEAMDYSDRSNWMVYSSDTDFEVDTVFLYPTSVPDDCQTTVSDVTDGMKQKAMKNYLKNGAEFSSFTNVYAPYYRQISFVGIMEDLSVDGLTNTIRKNVPRPDVFAALDYYFENINNGKPFFFASHSQGSASFKIVFEEYMVKHPEYMDRLIASYNVGYYFPDTWFEANPHIKKATGETDTGCLICWNTEAPGEKTMPGANGASDGFCINPLNWKTDETPAPLSANLGSVEVGDDNVQVFVDGKADATLDLSRGALICTTDTEDAIYDNPAFENGSLHFEDCALYYNNIVENAKKRMAAFLNS